ncbi:putative bifunctional diguanylate cyclase/phosphodiesterase [Aromatoleum petrolei]|uniref:EAL domain-containing protein n=1 Tax=Aromatoleum petrolei TaxID=76116 RepID=A0ABX1MVA1_9RHOO|nr:GGDEF domain-containing protein [Aromatoleum petrolei]NMF89022.1 EAL domain-containing protein [Aromatoleum petrolei]QTQ34382.1 Putative diguanylate cyclase/phosphodiesterase [Aromatoleum petrolei]
MDGAKDESTRPPEAACVSIEDYKRLYRALKTLSAGNRTLARAVDEEALLQDMCHAIVDQGGYRMAWIGYADRDERRTIRMMACAGAEEGIWEVFPLSWADDIKHPTALAIRSGAPRVSHLVQEDPALAFLHAEQRKRGYVAVSAFPLIIDGQVEGNLTIIAGDKDAFGNEEVNVLSELAEDVAFGIGALRARNRQQEAEAALQRVALYDPVTDLPNRSLFHKRLGELIARAPRTPRPFAVSIVALDQFREVNELLGAQHGNELLVQAAAILRPLLDDEDLLARVSDDEFAVLWRDTDAERAGQRAVRVLAAFDQPLKLSGFAIDARPRVGIALFPGHGPGPDALMRRAALASREARQSPGNFAIFTGNLDRDCNRNLSLVAELHHAIADEQLRLYCQPKVDIATGIPCGAEALVRWAHPEHGLIGPDRFIKMAEKAGLITPLTNWVLGEAFRQVYTWQSDGIAVPLAINLSTRDLLDSRLVDRIRGLFLTWGVDAGNVQFEITESALLEDPRGSLETLKRLRDLGVHLAIDDFGTGFSSLTYLQRLPTDSIKIDQSFVGRMLEHEGSDAIVRSTIDLGHDLGLSVIAEGVEDQATWTRLAALKCDVAQGYFISQPLPAEEFASWHLPEDMFHATLH